MTQQAHVVNDLFEGLTHTTNDETVLQQALASKEAIKEIFDSLLEKVEEVLNKYPVL